MMVNMDQNQHSYMLMLLFIFVHTWLPPNKLPAEYPEECHSV